MRVTIWGVVGFAILLAAGCSKSGPPDGSKVFVSEGCPRCHKRDGSGSSLAPALADLKQKWTPEDLDRFLANPPAYAAQDARLRAYRKVFTDGMPNLDLSLEARKALVVFLLAKRK